MPGVEDTTSFLKLFDVHQNAALSETDVLPCSHHADGPAAACFVRDTKEERTDCGKSGRVEEIQVIAEIQRMFESENVLPSHFKGRIFSMSMYNDFDWGQWKRNEGMCESDPSRVAACASQFEQVGGLSSDQVMK